jgi:hypothetical protein
MFGGETKELNASVEWAKELHYVIKKRNNLYFNKYTSYSTNELPFDDLVII